MVRRAGCSALQPVLATDVLLVSDGNPTYRYFAQDAGISHDANSREGVLAMALQSANHARVRSKNQTVPKAIARKEATRLVWRKPIVPVQLAYTTHEERSGQRTAVPVRCRC